MSKKITVTAKEVVTDVKDGAKTAVTTFKEISANLKTVSPVAEAPLKCFEVELKGLGEDYLPEPSLFKYNEDSAQILEAFSRFFGRPIAELSLATEALRINAAKVFTESQTASDNLLLITDWIREISDDLQNQVTIFASFGKVLTDHQLAIDTVTKSVAKVFTESQTASDNLLFDWVREINNDLQNQVTIFVSFGKVLADHQLAIDTVAKSVAKGFSDSNLATDIVTSVFQASKQDTSATNDSITFLMNYGHVIQDWVHATDDVLGTVEGDKNKTVAELRTIGEELSSALNKHTSVDVWSTNDIVMKSANISLRDFFGVPDVLGKSLAASKADAAAMSHACTANLQNYMSASYVDVGYVGFNYTL